jgi:hypothetical protein
MGKGGGEIIKGTVARVRLQLEYLCMEEGRRPAVRMIGCHSCKVDP